MPKTKIVDLKKLNKIRIQEFFIYGQEDRENFELQNGPWTFLEANRVADNLAKRARHATIPDTYLFSCEALAHVPSCNVKEVLDHFEWDIFSPILLCLWVNAKKHFQKKKNHQQYNREPPTLEGPATTPRGLNII